MERWVERGGIKRALESSEYDASSLLARLIFYVVMLFVLQLAFGVFGPNPITELITGIIGYLLRIFVAIVIVVVGVAIANAVRQMIQGTFGGLDYGRTLGLGASWAILAIAVFAALDQLQIAPNGSRSGCRESDRDDQTRELHPDDLGTGPDGGEPRR